MTTEKEIWEIFSKPLKLQLVGKVRAQLEDYYKSLSKEKAREERRSLWRIQRIKLNRLRRAHHLLEITNLNRELRDHLERGKSSASRQISDEREELEAGNEEEVDSEETSTSQTTTVKARKTWDQPISIELNISIDESNTDLKDVSLISSAGKGSSDNSNPENPNGNSGDQASDDDSEISFNLQSHTEEPQTSETADQPISRLNSEGEDMKKLLYSGQSETKSEPFVESKYEPESQMKDVLYGKDDGENQEAKKSSSRLDSEGDEMKNILYSKSSKSESGKSAASTQHPNRLASEGGDMRDLLYSRNKSQESQEEVFIKPVSRMDSEGNEMRDVLYSRSSSEKTKDSGSKKSVSRLDSEASEMKDILYSRSNSEKTEESTSKKSVSRLNSEGTDVKDILYASNKPEVAKEHVISQYEPAGQMKTLLYGDETTTSGYSSLKPHDSETETEEITEEMVTPTPSVKSKRVYPVDRMREILYGQPQFHANQPEDKVEEESSGISIGGK